jgi:hypothetical protein
MAEDDQNSGVGAGAGSEGAGSSGDGAGAGAAGSGAGEGAVAAAGDKGAGSTQAFTISKDYAEKGWAKKVKSQADLEKLADNLDSLAGKKYAVPDLSKTEDPDVKAYLDTLRGNTKREDYKFGDNIPKAVADQYAEVFYGSGVPKVMAERIITAHNKIMADQQAALFSEEGMTVELKEAFGDDYKKRSGDAVNLVADLLSPEEKAFMEKGLPNPIVGFMYKFIDKVKEKYGIKETGAAGEGDQAGDAGSGDVQKVRAGIRAEIRALTGRQHTAEEKKALQDKLDKTYQ